MPMPMPMPMPMQMQMPMRSKSTPRMATLLAVLLAAVLAMLLVSTAASAAKSSSSSSSSSFIDPATKVVQLTRDTFDAFVRRPTRLTFVFFYSPKSGKSKQARPEVYKFTQFLAGLADVAAVDCLADSSFCETQDVDIDEAIPVFKLYHGTSAPKRYGGPSSARKWSDFLMQHFPDNIHALSVRKAWTKAAQPRFLFFTGKHDHGPHYRSIALEFANDAVFEEVHSSHKDMLRKFDVTDYPQAFAEHKGEPPVRFTEPMAYDSLYAFIKEQIEYHKKRAGAGAGAGEGAGAGADGGAGAGAGADAGASDYGVPQLIDDSCVQRHCIERGALCAILVPSPSSTESAGISPALATELQRWKAIENARGDGVAVYSFSYVNTSVPAVQSFLKSAFALEPTSYAQLVVLSSKKMRYATYLGAWTNEAILDWMSAVVGGRIRTAPIESPNGVLPSLPAVVEGKEACPKVAASSSSSSSSSNSGKRSKADAEDEAAALNGESRFFRALLGSDFDDVVLPSPAAWLVLFTNGEDAPAEVEFAKVANKAKHMFEVAMFDATVEKALARSLGVDVSSGSVVKAFDAGVGKQLDAVKTYTGAIEAKALFDYAVSLISPHKVQLVTGDNAIERYMTTEPEQLHVVVFASSGTVPPLVSALSNVFAERVLFGVVPPSDKAMRSSFGVTKPPAVFVLQVKAVQNDGQAQLQAAPYQGVASYPDLLTFVQHAVAQHVKEKMSEGGGKAPDHDEL